VKTMSIKEMNEIFEEVGGGLVDPLGTSTANSGENSSGGNNTVGSGNSSGRNNTRGSGNDKPSNPDDSGGDEGGAVFIYVLLAGVAFIAFMAYKGKF